MLSTVLRMFGFIRNSFGLAQIQNNQERKNINGNIQILDRLDYIILNYYQIIHLFFQNECAIILVFTSDNNINY